VQGPDSSLVVECDDDKKNGRVRFCKTSDCKNCAAVSFKNNECTVIGDEASPPGQAKGLKAECQRGSNEPPSAAERVVPLASALVGLLIALGAAAAW
jgi:hypothetical protein